MNLLDYTFYRFGSYYTNRWSDNQGYFYGTLIVIWLTISHLYTLLLFTAFISKEFNCWFFEPLIGLNYTKSWTSIPIFFLTLILVIIFNKKRYLRMCTIWENEEIGLKFKRKIGLFIYIPLSVVLPVFLSIERGHFYHN